MRFSNVQVIVDPSALSRRVLEFRLFDASMVLDYDADEERQTTRHKFKVVRLWERIDQRFNTMQRRDVPEHAIQQALEQFRQQIRYEQ